MDLPECVGSPCKTVEFIVTDIRFRGVILNADDPPEEWITTIPEALSPALRNSWQNTIIDEVTTKYAARARVFSDPCGAGCRCSPIKVEETRVEDITHRRPVREAGTNKVLAIGYATYKLQMTTTTGNCLPDGETQFGYLQQPSDTFVALTPPKKRGARGAAQKGRRRSKGRQA